MSKQFDLCKACAEQMKEAYAVKKISGGIDNKVTCDNCGRRRYGATYELTKEKSE